jgi:NPCBM/NEW2 domain
MMISCRLLFAFVILAIAAAQVHADDWSITTSDFQTQPAVLKSFSAQGVEIVSPDSKNSLTVPLDRFVSIQRGGSDDAVAPKFTLVLSNGDRVVGEPGPVTGEKLIWLSPSLGKVPVPFNRLVVIGKGDAVTPPAEAPKQDIVTLANGDTAAGVFSNCDNGNVTLQADAGPVTIPLASMTRIAFAWAGLAAVDSSRAFRIHLADGTLLTAPDVASKGDQLSITLPGKNAAVVSIPLVDVLGIEQTNGPVGWLSSRTPTENIQTPYLGGGSHWPAKFDSAVDGSPLSFDGKIYNHGIGVHAYSKLTFAIDPQWTTFRTQYAVESHRDDPARYADVWVRIKLDGKIVREELHFREGVLSPVVTVDLKGATTLTLECDYGDAGDTQAHLNWLEPALLREVPAATTTAPATAP